MDYRPRLAVSRCLLGEAVRYDGGDKRHEVVVGAVVSCCRVSPFCPEVAAGLGVPRPPVQIVRDGLAARLIGADDASVDVTPRLMAVIQRDVAQFAEVHGVIFKARSPSCGVQSTPIFAKTGEQIGIGDGLFAAAVRRRFPLLPVIDELGLEHAEKRAHFFERVFAYRDWQHLRRVGATPETIRQFGDRYRCHLALRRGGGQASRLRSSYGPISLEAYERTLFTILARPPEAKRAVRLIRFVTGKLGIEASSRMEPNRDAYRLLRDFYMRVQSHERSTAVPLAVAVFVALSEEERRLRFDLP